MLTFLADPSPSGISSSSRPRFFELESIGEVPLVLSLTGGRGSNSMLVSASFSPLSSALETLPPTSEGKSSFFGVSVGVAAGGLPLLFESGVVALTLGTPLQAR